MDDWRKEGEREGVTDLYCRPETENKTNIDSKLSIISTGGLAVPPCDPPVLGLRTDESVSTQTQKQSLYVVSCYHIGLVCSAAEVVADAKICIFNTNHIYGCRKTTKQTALSKTQQQNACPWISIKMISVDRLLWQNENFLWEVKTKWLMCLITEIWIILCFGSWRGGFH